MLRGFQPSQPGMNRSSQRPTQPTRLFLIGPMGAGKTTVGLQLAQRLGLEFRDSDREIEARTGASIPLIFELEGEEGFRNREAAMIDELTQHEAIVLATGGGAVLRLDNRERLSSRGVVIYLYATVDQLVSRTGKDRNRPLLNTADPRARLAEIMAVREPLYREIAQITLETGDRTVRHVVQEIVQRIRTPAHSRQDAQHR